jgi:hypothetical protein
VGSVMSVSLIPPGPPRAGPGWAGADGISNACHTTMGVAEHRRKGQEDWVCRGYIMVVSGISILIKYKCNIY